VEIYEAVADSSGPTLIPLVPCACGKRLLRATESRCAPCAARRAKQRTARGERAVRKGKK